MIFSDELLMLIVVDFVGLFFWTYYLATVDPVWSDILYKAQVLTFLLLLSIFGLLLCNDIRLTKEIMIDAVYFKDEDSGARYYRHPGSQKMCITPEKLKRIYDEAYLDKLVKEGKVASSYKLVKEGKVASPHIIVDDEDTHLSKIAKDSGLSAYKRNKINKN